MQQGEFIYVVGKAVGERHDDRKDHGSCADHSRADQHRFGRGFERVAGAVIFFQQILGALEVRVDTEIAASTLL